MPKGTKYVAAKAVTLGLGKDGREVKTFEPGEEVPGAADLPTITGLVAGGYLAEAGDYNGKVTR